MAEGDSGSQQTGPNLPSFDPNKVYLVAGKSLNAMVAASRSERPRVVDGGGLKIAQITEQGTFLALDDSKTIDLIVCVNGSPVTKTFLLAK